MGSLVDIKRELSRIDLKGSPDTAWLVRKEITNVISARLIWDLKIYSHRVSEQSCANCNVLDCCGVLYEPCATDSDDNARGFCTKHCDPIVKSFIERRDVRRILDAIVSSVELGRNWSARKNLTKLGRKYVRWIRSYPSDLLDDPTYPGEEEKFSLRLRGAPVGEGVLSSRAGLIGVRIGIEFMRLTLDPDYRVLRYSISVVGSHLSDGKHVPDLVRGHVTYERIEASITDGMLPLEDGMCLIDGRMKEILRIVSNVTSR